MRGLSRNTLRVRRLPVVENGRLVGIVTQTDITRALISLNSLGGVSDIMTMHFHRLLVTDDKGICGLVTQTDIMRAVRESSEAAESQQRLLKEELADLLQRAVRDMQRVRDFLGGIPPHRPNRICRRVSNRRFRNRRFLAPIPLRKYRDHYVFLLDSDNRGDFCPQLSRGRIENNECFRRNALMVCEQTEAQRRDTRSATWV